MSPVASSTDEHSVARLSSSNASKKSPSGRLTSPAAYVFAPSWMANSKESHKPSNLAFSSFSTSSPNAISPQRAVPVKTHNPAPRSSNSSPYPGRPLHKLQPKPHHDINTTTTTTTINPATTATTATPPSSYRSEQPDSSGSLQESEFPILGEDAASDKRHAGRSAWSNPNAIKAKVLCPPAAASDESNAEIPLSPNDIELERLKALVPKRRSGAASSSSKRLSHHHHHHHNHHHNHHQHHPASPLISPTPSRSLSSTQRMRPNSKQSAAMRNSNNGSSNSSGNGNTNSVIAKSASNGNIRTSPLTKLPLHMASRETAVVKLPAAASSSSRPKRASSSGSSISSTHSQHSACDQRLEAPPRICELTDDTTTTTSSPSLLASPRTLMDEDIMEEASVVAVDHHDVIGIHGVNEHEREHFVSWVRAWASRPAVKAAATMEVPVINPRFFGSCGEYSYFGPLGHHRISR